eukprot:10009921-Ditylum_brightwellii.AAC.1
MLSKLDKHWDLVHSHICKPQCLQSLSNVEHEIKRKAVEDERKKRAGKQQVKKKSGKKPKSLRKMKK